MMTIVTAENVVSMADQFADLDDPRCSIIRKHLLGDLIVICICGVLSGADGPLAIGVWETSNAAWLKKHLELPAGIPSHDTIGRLLALLQPKAFQACFENWIRCLRSAGAPPDATDKSTAEIIAIDGKALRRSHDRTHSIRASGAGAAAERPIELRPLESSRDQPSGADPAVSRPTALSVR